MGYKWIEDFVVQMDKQIGIFILIPSDLNRRNISTTDLFNSGNSITKIIAT